MTVQEELSIISDYLSGKNTVELAKQWNTYNTSIRRILLKHGITPRTGVEAHTTIKTCPFKDSDEQSEYFFGLLLTDGCICHRGKNSYTITLGLKDKEMVEQFKTFLGSQNKIAERLQQPSNTYLYTLSVRNKLIADWLQQRGNFIDKSNKCDIYIPITPHILRGIFDGDGYWHTTNKGNSLSWGICGKSYIFLEKIKNYLQTKGIKSTLRKGKKPNNNYLYYLEIYKIVDIVKAALLMYKEAHIYLKRKYDKWHLFEETLKVKFSKFKEREASPNPEPSHNKRFIMEGAETIMRLLSEFIHMEKG